MAAGDLHQAEKKGFLYGAAVGGRGADFAEHTRHQPVQPRILNDRAQDNILRLCAHGERLLDQQGIDIQHLPAARAVQRRAVVNFAGVDHNDVAGSGVNFADMAPRTLGAVGKNADTEPVVRVAGEAVLGE